MIVTSRKIKTISLPGHEGPNASVPFLKCQDGEEFHHDPNQEKVIAGDENE